MHLPPGTGIIKKILVMTKDILIKFDVSSNCDAWELECPYLYSCFLNYVNYVKDGPDGKTFRDWLYNNLKCDGVVNVYEKGNDKGDFTYSYTYEFVFGSDEDKTLFCLKYL